MVVPVHDKNYLNQRRGKKQHTSLKSRVVNSSQLFSFFCKNVKLRASKATYTKKKGQEKQALLYFMGMIFFFVLSVGACTFSFSLLIRRFLFFFVFCLISSGK